jgi:hypothetical protein
VSHSLRRRRRAVGAPQYARLGEERLERSVTYHDVRKVLSAAARDPSSGIARQQRGGRTGLVTAVSATAPAARFRRSRRRDPNPAVDRAVVGFRTADQGDPILLAASIDLTNQDIAEVEGNAQ